MKPRMYGVLKYLCTKFQIISLQPFSTLQEGQGNHKLGLGGAILVPFYFWLQRNGGRLSRPCPKPLYSCWKKTFFKKLFFFFTKLLFGFYFIFNSNRQILLKSLYSVLPFVLLPSRTLVKLMLALGNTVINLFTPRVFL